MHTGIALNFQFIIIIFNLTVIFLCIKFTVLFILTILLDKCQMKSFKNINILIKVKLFGLKKFFMWKRLLLKKIVLKKI